MNNILSSPKSKLLLRSIGLILFIFILSQLNLTKTWELLSNISLFYMAIALSLIIPLLVTKAWRWQLLMRAQDIEYSLKDSTIMYAAAMYIGAMTPARLGDFIKIFYLKGDDYPLGKSFATVLLDRLFDLVSLLLLGYAGMLLFIALFERAIIILSFILIGTFVLVIFFIYKKELSKRTLEYITCHFIPGKYRERTKTGFSDLYNDNALKTLNVNQLVWATFITFFGWTLYFLMMYLLALSIDIHIPLLYLVTCISIVTVITLIPISIAGIGTRDATLIILFSYLGLSKETAIAFSMMILLMYAVSGLIGLGAWLKKPIGMTKASAIKRGARWKNEK